MPEFSYLAPTLLLLYIDENAIQSCGALCDTEMNKLNTVYLERNEITDVPLVSILQNWPSVKSLKLNYLHIENLQDYSHVKWQECAGGTFIEMANTTWLCDSRVQWLLPLKEINLDAKKYEFCTSCACIYGLKTATCAGLAGLENKTLSELSPDDLPRLPMYSSAGKKQQSSASTCVTWILVSVLLGLNNMLYFIT